MTIVIEYAFSKQFDLVIITVKCVRQNKLTNANQNEILIIMLFSAIITYKQQERYN